MIPVLKANNLSRYFTEGSTSYIFANDVSTEEELKAECPHIFQRLSRFRPELERRFQYGGEIPWWKWVFLRNFDLIESSTQKILVPCKERIDKRDFVRFALAEGRYYSTQDVTAIVKKSETREDVRFILAILNSGLILTWMKFKGLSRGGVLEFSERPLSSIPMRLIDWEDVEDVRIHDEIVKLAQRIIDERLITELSRVMIESRLRPPSERI
jgi:adenine-specific DNA-methyltransferase